MSKEIMLLIDGNSLVHRAYHAVRPLSTAAGLPTNAVYGFTGMLIQLLKREQPQRIAVAFDIGKKNFRHGYYQDYKAHRHATPEDLQTQFPLVKDMVRSFGITLLELEGYEADDILGTLSAIAEQNGQHSLIITGDRDLLQLVSPATKVLMTQKGIRVTEIFDEEKVYEKYGLSPCQLTDLKGLSGDSSDNIPGIKGIGEKTAVKLLKEFGSLEGVISNINSLSGRVQQLLLLDESVRMAELSKQLGTICRDVPLEINLEQCNWSGPDYDLLWPLFDKLEFKSLRKSVIFDFVAQPAARHDAEQDLTGGNVIKYETNYSNIDNQQDMEEFTRLASQAGCLAVALEGNFHTGITAAGFALENKAYLLSIPDDEQCNLPAFDFLKGIFLNHEIKIYCYNGKEIIKLLYMHGYTINNLAFDIMLAAYLLNPTASNGRITDIAREYLETAISDEGLSLAAQAEIILKLTSIMERKLTRDDSLRLLTDVELPLVHVLAEMEITGVTVDKSQLRQMSESLGETLESLVIDIHGLAGSDFNINSAKQLGKVLFEDLKLPVIKKTKTGYSTDAAVLEKLAGSHEVAAKILDYRQLAKLKSTYTDALAQLVNPHTGRLHTTFHQAVTATGRLSSSDPNLQNIPVRMELGRRIRKVFIPSKEGNIILSADYSQIELRLLAHLSNDPVLIDAFVNNEDIHTRTASEIFGIPLGEVSKEARQRAKAINFGIVYGLSDFGLSRDIKIPRREAKQYIENYFTRYAGVKNYIDSTIAEAHAKGYVTTLLNRRRYLPELYSRNQMIRSASERTAINTPVQGSAADIIKLAMLKIYQSIKDENLQASMILQVHDELIFDAPVSEAERLRELVKNSMENAYTLKVPLDVVINAGSNWYAAK